MARHSGGCLGKVDADSLIALLQASGLATRSRFDFADAEVTNLPENVNSVATSTDLIYDFGADPHDFGWIAVVHALSDLYAALSTPLVVTVCLGLTVEQMNDGSGAKILAGACAGLEACGAVLGGGHTVYSGETFVAVSVVGLDSQVSKLGLRPESAYDLLLSKPLGAGIYISAKSNDVLDTDGFSELVDWMKIPNEEGANSLTKLLERDPDAVGFVTDVTGFGLLTALHSKMRAGWQASIDVEIVPHLSQSIHLLEHHGIVSTLGERNMLWAREEGECELGSTSMTKLLVLSDPQTNGGLLAAVRRDLSDVLVAQTKSRWVRIGSVTTAAEVPSPMLRLTHPIS